MVVNTSWIATLLLGFGAMQLMKRTPDWLDAILIRAAALLVAGAGAMGLTGWLGGVFTYLLGKLTDFVNWITSGAFGTPLMGILAFFVGVLWVGSFLPERLFRGDYPDWLIFAGLPLPTLLTLVPGKAGDFLEMLVLSGSHWLVQWVGSWFA
jgi:hypothetical protein